ncbi:AraC-like DNA-binding protein [Amycolatopsis lexingtonensis]|uniref:AraC-like DNA-binding protein n=1 Tax=Amycolatopsis lexingtonensis TaxID=218822 RepID=A0ABR9ICN9_9PSEU|nr:AraC family transcriptional regulator [Amycolatopsis lexingtonensis]MBE1500949.1 AraC-like DNA-binding protein [Amycolatopsis lexingtonensis]
MRGTTVPPGTPCPPTRPGELPMHRLEVPAPHSPPIAVGTFDALGPLSRAEFPHRHTFHELVHVTGGTGAHVVELARWPLRPPHLGVIAPGQVHQWADVRGLDGHVVVFTDDFLLDYPADRELLRRLSARPWLELDARANAGVTRLIADLEDEYRRGGDDSESVLRALLHVLVVRAGRLPGTPEAPPAPAGAVAAEFARLSARTELGLWSVTAHAERIGVTPGHLTEAVKAATGRTAAQLLREARTREAQRFLLRTDLTVRQVASRVGFADPAYFCRFFRRETGLSPGDFRRAGEIHHD